MEDIPEDLIRDIQGALRGDYQVVDAIDGPYDPSVPGEKMVLDPELSRVVLERLDTWSLDAVKIRGNVCSMMIGEVDGQTAVRIEGDTITDLDFTTGQEVVNFGDKSAHDRIVVEIARENGLRLIAWTDARENGLLNLVERPHDDESISSSPIHFGLGKVGFDGRQLFVPVLKSIVTESGCNVVIPSGSDIDILAYNKSEILDILDKLIEDGTTYASGSVHVSDLLSAVSRALITNPEGIALQHFIERATATRSNTVVDALLGGELDSIRRTARRLQVSDGSWIDMNIVGNTFETKQRIDDETKMRQFEYFLQDRGVQKGDDDSLYREYILWGGLDPDEYTQPGVALMFPRYAFRQGEFARPEIVWFENGNISIEQEAPPEGIRDLLHILEAKLGRNNRRVSPSSEKDNPRSMNVDGLTQDVLDDLVSNMHSSDSLAESLASIARDRRVVLGAYPPRPGKKRRSITGIVLPG